MKSLLLPYSKKRFLAILEISDTLSREISVDTVHQLRVELKKVRFLVHLLMRYQPNDKIKKSYKPFKQLFIHAGKLRGQHVNLYRTNQVDTEKQEQAIRTHFIHKEEKYSKQFGRLLRADVIALKKGMKLLEYQISKFPEFDPKVWVYNLASRVFFKLTMHTPKRKLHRCRHLLKEIIYGVEFSDETAQLLNQIFDLKKVAQLEDVIGDWHDLSILLKRTTHVNRLSQKVISKIEKKKEDKIDLLFQLIPQISQPIIS
jgi:CHAD domain-containing protein